MHTERISSHADMPRVLVSFLEPCSASRVSGLINPDENINIAVEMKAGPWREVGQRRGGETGDGI